MKVNVLLEDSISPVKRLCYIKDCNRLILARGLCSMHYKRWYRSGNPHTIYKEFHGMTNTNIYIVYTNMIARCENKQNSDYKRYGGRGIAICIEWRNSFLQFYADMGDVPFKGAKLDRIDNDKNYCKENCRWATNLENCNNRYYKAKGVSFVRRAKKWRAELTYFKEKFYLGYFETEEDALTAYRNKAKELGKRIDVTN